MKLTYHERRRAISAARALFQDPNVLAIGIGEKNGQRTGEHSLVVTVARKPELEAVPRGYQVPPVLRVPPSPTKPGFELPTDVVEGERKRFAAAAATASAPGGSLRIRPEGHASEGTLGGLVVDQHGNVFVLSCSHVLSDYGRVGELGARIIELGGNQPIARLSRYLKPFPGPNFADVAIARLDSSELVDALLPRAPVAGVAPGTPAQGDPVEMVVQGPAPNVGRVSQTDVEEKVYGWGGHDSAYVLMSGQIEVEGLGTRGDSGAVVTDSKRRAVALFVADNGFRDLATPIKTALRFAGKPELMVHAEEDLGLLEFAFFSPNAET